MNHQARPVPSRRRLVGSIIATTALLLLPGCGQDVTPEDAAAAVEASRPEVDRAWRDTAAVAGEIGFKAPEASGSWSVCSAEPPRLKYRAGGQVLVEDSTVADAVVSLTDALENVGWEVESEGLEPEPYAVLTQGDLQASLGESRRDPGTVSMGVTGPCVETTSAQDSLLSEDYTIS